MVRLGPQSWPITVVTDAIANNSFSWPISSHKHKIRSLEYSLCAQNTILDSFNSYSAHSCMYRGTGHRENRDVSCLWDPSLHRLKRPLRYVLEIGTALYVSFILVDVFWICWKMLRWHSTDDTIVIEWIVYDFGIIKSIRND